MSRHHAQRIEAVPYHLRSLLVRSPPYLCDVMDNRAEEPVNAWLGTGIYRELHLALIWTPGMELVATYCTTTSSRSSMDGANWVCCCVECGLSTIALVYGAGTGHLYYSVNYFEQPSSCQRLTASLPRLYVFKQQTKSRPLDIGTQCGHRISRE